MYRSSCAAALLALLPVGAFAQEAAGTLTLTLGGEERKFLVVQDPQGPNPGSRYSRLAGDVVFNLVAISGDEPIAPDDAEETVELRFTVAEEGPEVRAGSVISYSTKDAEGMPATRGGTAEITLDTLEAESDVVNATGSFVAQLPPDQTSDATEIEGTFETAMKSREAMEP